MLSVYRTSALVAPLKAGVRPIATSAILMAKKKEVGELFNLSWYLYLVSGGGILFPSGKEL